MRRATFTNRAVLALLASFVVALAFGESPEPTKVRITTWNLEWFPNGSAHDATPELQTQRIAAAADVFRPINPDIVLLQEVRDYDVCAAHYWQRTNRYPESEKEAFRDQVIKAIGSRSKYPLNGSDRLRRIIDATGKKLPDTLLAKFIMVTQEPIMRFEPVFFVERFKQLTDKQ